MASRFEDLARRAVACKGWRWMPGMMDAVDSRVGVLGDEAVRDRQFDADSIAEALVAALEAAP